MKKFLILFLVVSSTISVAQESVLLRLKYKKGDVYSIKMNQSINSPAMMMGMNIDMGMSVLSVDKNVYTSEMKISKMTMDMMQGGMQMSYDSTQKEEDLDEMGKMMSAQMSPMLKVVITAKTNDLGKNLETKVEPNMPNAEQFGSRGSVAYPEKAVKVGDTWTDEKEAQGMKTAMEYKVTKITKDKVFLEVSGKITGAGTGTTNGTLEIERSSGIPLKSLIKSNVNASGQEMKVEVTLTMTKK